MKNIYIFFLLTCLSYSAVAQDRDYDLYLYNTKTINPALMALTNEQNFDFQYRDLLDVDFESTPSMLLSYSNRLNKINSGVGFIFSRENIGILNSTNASLLYNYQFKLKEKSKLIIGTELRYEKQNIGLNPLEANNADLEILGQLNQRVGTLDLGILYQIGKLNLSLNAHNVISTNNETLFYRYGTGRLYNLYVSNEFSLTHWLKITPSVLYKTDFSNYYADINGMGMIKNTLLLGITERTDDDHTFGIYNAGISVKNKVQFIVGVNTANRHFFGMKMIEFMLRVKISNE